MAISHVEIKDFMVFRGEFVADFCPGVNVIIGGNGTGKTTLLRRLYKYKNVVSSTDNSSGLSDKVCVEIIRKPFNNENCNVILDNRGVKNSVFIPEKDILEHAKGLLPFIDQKETGFSRIYRDILITAQDVYTKEQSETQKMVGEIIAQTIGGTAHRDESDGSFYTQRTDGARVPFTNEASGYKKFGFLGLLVTSGQLENGSVLLWDEPENSLNPELIPVLVDVLLRLSRNGVQIFIATHDYNLARYFDIRKDKSVPVMFHNLSKSQNSSINCKSSSEYIKLPDNLLETASADLFKAVVADAMEVQDDE
jgi:AAA15 family ATPase/GTPase